MAIKDTLGARRPADIELPEVTVTPNEPNHMAQGLVAGAPDFLSPAQQPQHTEILPTDLPSAQRIAGHAGAEDIRAPLWEPQPGKTPEPVQGKPDANTRAAYADALKNGEVHGPQDFAERHFGSLWGAARDNIHSPEEMATDQQENHLAWMTNAAKGMASTMPTNEALIDYSIGIAKVADVPPTPEHVSVIHNNLLDHWARTGEDPARTYERAQHDPMTSDVLSHTQPPETYDDLKRRLPPDMLTPGKDAIHDPLGNMQTDPTGLVGMAKQVLELPDQQGNWLEKQQAAKKEGKVTENWLDSPAGKFFGQFLIMSLVAKGATATVSAVKKVVPQKAKDTMQELWKDERGGPGQVGTPTPKPEKQTFTEADVDERAKTLKGRQSARREEARKAFEAEGKEAADERTPEQMKSDVQAAMDELAKGKRFKKSPDLPPPTGIKGDGFNFATPMEDDLNRLRTNAEADKIELTKLVSKLPKEWRNVSFQEKAYKEVEARLIDPNATISPETQAFLDAIKPLTDRQTMLARRILPKLERRVVADDDPMLQSIKGVEGGYVHRMKMTDEEAASASSTDPNVGRDDVVRGQIADSRPNTLSKFAPGTQARVMYTLDNGAGQRIFSNKPLASLELPDLPNGRKEARIGDTITDAAGKKWTIKDATTEEIEANTDIRYRKNFLANTAENVARLARVDRNLTFLETNGAALEEQGLFVRRKPGESAQVIPEGMVRVELPQMDGWAEPKIANVLNDFFARSGGDLEWAITKANRFLMSALFISPMTHIGNVGMHWAPGRGWDWITPSGMGSMMADGYKALREVWTLGPRYLEHLREGSGLLYATTQTENFYRTLINKISNEVMADQRTWGSYVKSFMGPGYAVADLAAAMYRQSRRALWFANDVFMLQRQFELQRRGQSLREAIFNAEKDIPNYRIPSEVMGTHALSQFLQSPNVMNFGRYRYGQIRAIALVVKDLLGTQVAGKERLEALGKLTVGAAIAMGVYPLFNSVLQHITGNANAEVKPFGPFSLSHAVQGIASGTLDWAAGMASLITFAPVLDIAKKVVSNRDQFGRKIRDDKSTALGQFVQSAEGALDSIYPGQLLMKAIRHGSAGMEQIVGDLLGLKLPPPQDPRVKQHYDALDARTAAHREAKDSLENWFKQQLGIAPAPAPAQRHQGGGGHKGRGKGGAL